MSELLLEQKCVLYIYLYISTEYILIYILMKVPYRLVKPLTLWTVNAKVVLYRYMHNIHYIHIYFEIFNYELFHVRES